MPPIDRVDQLPLPSLQWYAGFSGLALFYAIVYALTAPDGFVETLENDVWCTAVGFRGLWIRGDSIELRFV